MFFEKICAQSLDKNYAYLKLCSSEPSIAFTPSKARAFRAQSWLCKKRQEGKTGDAKKRIPSFFTRSQKK